MYEAAARSLRTAERFLLEPPLTAYFGASSVAVCDISAKGARFRHGQPVEMGQKSVLRLTIEGRRAPLSLEAVVVWTQTDGGTPGGFVSGVRTYASAEQFDGMIGQLQKTRRASRIEELRSADRFNVTPVLGGQWNGARVRIENLSAHGARVETPAQLAASDEGTLHFAVPKSAVIVAVRARVAWSSLKAVDPSKYRCGLLIEEKPELLRLAIGQLCESGRASLDTQSLSLKLKIIRARARQLAPSFRAMESSGIPAEQYVLIQCVREELRLNPDEAMHWYRRARITIADPKTREAAPAIADHPDALAVWEYLDRSIDASMIGKAFQL